jgi:hypothetical protein
MADEHDGQATIARYRHWYRKLLGFYSRPYRERFAEGMEQTFADMCRERVAAGKGLTGFVLWLFVETAAGIAKENATTVRWKMKADSTLILTTIKYGGITVCGLMVAGIATVMFLARGTGEDITGVVAPALLVTVVSGAFAIAAHVFQKRAKAIDIKANNDLRA